jgi:hypothetical protein
MLTMTTTIGRIVHVIGTPANGNGADVAPALVTRVWADDMINCTVFPDCGPPVPATSVRIVGSEQEARDINANTEYPQTLAFWPPRV